MQQKKDKIEFSKKLLLQESALIWLITIAFIILAFVCIINQYFGELPWITAMTACPWGAYAISQQAYYKKAEKENTKGGIKYESIIKMLETQDNTPPIPEEEFVEDACG